MHRDRHESCCCWAGTEQLQPARYSRSRLSASIGMMATNRQFAAFVAPTDRARQQQTSGLSAAASEFRRCPCLCNLRWPRAAKRGAMGARRACWSGSATCSNHLGLHERWLFSRQWFRCRGYGRQRLGVGHTVRRCAGCDPCHHGRIVAVRNDCCANFRPAGWQAQERDLPAVAGCDAWAYFLSSPPCEDFFPISSICAAFAGR